MNRAVSGTLVELESGRPIPDLLVLVVRLLPGGMELLGDGVSGDYGRFRVTYEPLTEAADLSLLLFSWTGRLLFTEPVHRNIAGAELRIAVEVPKVRLTEAGC